MTRAGAAIALLAFAIAAAGCASSPSEGYAFASVYRTDVRTVAVPVFQNTTFAHGVETRLTEAIVKEIHRTTPWAVVSSGAADTTLSGTIRAGALESLGTGPDTGYTSELGYVLGVDFEWRDNRSGRPLIRRRNFRAAGSFVPARGAGEPIDIGEQAAVEAMAKEIVDELRSDW